MYSSSSKSPSRPSVIVRWLLAAVFACAGWSATAQSPLIHFSFDDFDETVTTANNSIAVPNLGSAGGSGTLIASGDGSITPATGPAGGSDVAIRLNDANDPGSTSNQGGRLTVHVPQITGAYTIGLSLRFAEDGNHVQWDHLFDGFANPSSSGQTFTLTVQTDNTLRWRVHGNLDTSGYNDNEWHHLLMTYDGEHQWLLYRNGEQVASRNDTDRTHSLVPEEAGRTITFGTQANTHRPFDGFLDNIMIFDHALSATEVEQLHANTLIPEPATVGLVGGILALAAVCWRRRNA